MNWKLNNIKAALHLTPNRCLSFSGGGKVATSVANILNSPKVQRQVAEVRKIADSYRLQNKRQY